MDDFPVLKNRFCLKTTGLSGRKPSQSRACFDMFEFSTWLLEFLFIQRTFLRDYSYFRYCARPWGEWKDDKKWANRDFYILVGANGQDRSVARTEC